MLGACHRACFACRAASRRAYRSRASSRSAGSRSRRAFSGSVAATSVDGVGDEEIVDVVAAGVGRAVGGEDLPAVRLALQHRYLRGGGTGVADQQARPTAGRVLGQPCGGGDRVGDQVRFDQAGPGNGLAEQAAAARAPAGRYGHRHLAGRAAGDAGRFVGNESQRRGDHVEYVDVVTGDVDLAGGEVLFRVRVRSSRVG